MGKTYLEIRMGLSLGIKDTLRRGMVGKMKTSLPGASPAPS